MSFLTPLFLAAAGVALVPVLLHLVRRMRAKELPFSSLMFLTATPMERIRRRKLRDVLLLVLRMAMIVLLAAAFARPFLVRERLPFVPERKDESVVILVDQSLSMQAGDTFDEALNALRRVIAASSAGDELALVGFSREAVQLAPLSRDRQRLEASATALRASSLATDFYPAFQLAEDILLEARHSAQRVVLISDMQRTGFTASMDEYTLPDGVTFEPIKVGPEEQANRYFEDVARTMRQRSEGMVTRLDARYVTEARGDAISMVIEDRIMDQKESTTAGRGRVAFHHLAPRPGLYQGYLSTESDALLADNRYYFTYEVAARPSILVVADDRDAFYLRSAFDLAEQSQFDFARGQRLAGAAFVRHDVVFAANTARLTPAQAAALRSFAEGGGCVVLSFGDALAETGYGLDQTGIGQVTSIVRAQDAGGAEAFVGQVDAQHEIFAGLAGSSALIRPKFRTYVHVVPQAGAAVLARYDNGDPLLIERRMGKGAILAFTSSFGTSWSNLALHELFVPLVYQMVNYAAALRERKRAFIVGDKVPLTGAAGAVWDVGTPTSEQYKVAMDTSETGFFMETASPGHYVAALRDDAYYFSVNADPRESDLTMRGAEETYAAIASGRGGTAAPQAAAYTDEEREQELKLWRFAILAVLGLFVLETLLAHRNRTQP